VIVGGINEIAVKDLSVNLLLKIQKGVKVPTDSMAPVKSRGIIDDNLIDLSLGGDQEFLEEGRIIVDT